MLKHQFAARLTLMIMSLMLFILSILLNIDLIRVHLNDEFDVIKIKSAFSVSL